MCNLSKGVWERGIKQGIERGIEQGVEKTTLSSLRNIVKNMGVSVEQAMSVLEIPESERQMYRELLGEQ